MASLLLAVSNLGVALRSARLERRGRRPWGTVFAFLAFAIWLGSSGLPYSAVATSLAALAYWIAGVGTARRRSVVLPTWTGSTVVGLTVLAMAQRAVLLPRNLVVWVPSVGDWIDGTIVAVFLLLLGHMTWRLASHARGALAAVLVGALLWAGWPLDAFDSPAWMRLPRTASAMGATHGAVSIDRFTALSQVVQYPKTHQTYELWIRVRSPLALLTEGIGTVVLVPHDEALRAYAPDKYRSFPVEGTLQGLLDACGPTYCRVEVDRDVWGGGPRRGP